MAITYIPFEELFAPEYQLTYITTDGHIDVGPNTYSVFHYYTMTERQQIFQVCEKHLPWETTQEQEQWERTQYMYQFIIKSPPPFPYEEYSLSEDIIMAITITWELDIEPISYITKWAFIQATRTEIDDVKQTTLINVYDIARVQIDTVVVANNIHILDKIWIKHQARLAKETVKSNFVNALELLGKQNLEARE